MDNNFLLTDALLWDYADGFLEAAEQQQVEAYLQQHPEHYQRLEAIRAEKLAFKALPLEKPQKGFADRVMAAWVAEQARAGALVPAKKSDWIIFSIAGAFGIMVLLAFALVLGSASAIEPVNLPQALSPEIPAVDWALLLDNPILRYGLMLTLVLLTLQILDKYLRQRASVQGLAAGH